MSEERTAEQRLAAHVVAPHAIPAEVARNAARFLGDYLAVTLSGAERDSAVAARRAFPPRDRDDVARSRLHGVDGWAPAEQAALLNGITAHGPELDDTHEESSLHPAVAVLPALLAHADDVGGIPWDAFVRAAAVGYDVMTSVGTLLGAAESYGRGFHPTGVAGALGATAAVVAATDADVETAAHALALAADLAAGSLEFLSDGSWTKRLNAGNAAATGIRAARLGAAGFRGPAAFLGGRDGFLRQYGQGAVDGRELGLAFGRGMAETSIKLYPCCRYMHGNIDLLRTVYDEHPGLDPETVQAVECAVIRAGATLVSEPPARKLVVGTSVDAQFNMPFGAALALTTGDAALAAFDDAPNVARGLGALMSRVTCYESERVEAAFPAAWQAEVRVRLTDGTVIERYEEAFRGSPGDPASEADLLAKAAGLVGAERAGVLADRIARLRPETPVSSRLLLDGVG